MAYCIPSFSGAPYSTATTLNWWDVAAPDPVADPAGATRSYPDDPDWLYGFSSSHGDGGTPHVTFRALSGERNETTYLLLSWVVFVDINPVAGNLNGDGVDLFLANGNEGIIVKMRLPSTSSTDTQPSKRRPPSIQCKRYTGGVEGDPIGADPTYATDTARCWIDYQSPSSSQKVKWAIQIAVPIGSYSNLFEGTGLQQEVTLPVGSAFKFWYNVHSLSYTDGNNVDQEAQYPWPQTNIYPSTDHTIPTSAEGFAPADLIVQPSNSSVCAQGITLDMNQIRVFDEAGTTDRFGQVAVDLEKNGSGQYVNNPPRHDLPKYHNMLVAAPTVPAGMQGNAAKIRGRFRFARWGSQSGIVTEDSWKTVPRGEQVNYDMADSRLELIWPQTTFNTQYESDYFAEVVDGCRKWKDWKDGGAQPPVPSNAMDPHQCLLVELTAADSSIFFSKSSAFNNFSFVQASTFQTAADISVVGLQPFSQRPRDVYLCLQKSNMPVKIEDGYPDVTPNVAKTKKRSAVKATGKKTIRYEDLVQWEPTYQVHAWHDTGKRIRRSDGRECRILAPQTSFGYIVSHDGNLVGWETRLYDAEKLLDNFYVVRVPNNGAVKVRTAIQARESANDAPLPPDGVPARRCLCSRLVAWLESKGWLGRLIALIVRFFCRLLGQSVS